MTATSTSIDTATLERSRAYCRDLTRRKARNFYYGLKLQPEPKRSAMYALYAWMRLVDDIADDDTNQRTLDQRRADLAQWQSLTRAALAGDTPRGHIVWPAFAELVRTYRVPAEYFDEMIDGQRQDLEPHPFATFEDLRTYCYRVASVVGLASLHVWGFTEGKAGERPTRDMAVDLGIAFQLTNIIRDLAEDASRGRIYLPAEDFTRFNVTGDNLSPDSPKLRDLLAFQTARAEEFYERAAGLPDRIAEDSRPTLRAMTAIYHGLLQQISKEPTVVLRRRVRLSSWKKLLIAYRAWRGR